MDYTALKIKVTDIVSQSGLLCEDKLLKICHLLRDSIDYYDWVGYYFANHERRELVLGPYAGEATDHVVIPFGKGICGQVAVSNQPFLVEDVAAQDNYISCNIQVKSEIVVPLFVAGKNIGQIDIDSNVKAAFTADDQQFLEEINQMVSVLFV
ncbi:GAF domain-containing protein [Flavobacterium sp. JP2137]|uniref:GAF domain-containing protein n=1 Tax=Flavobacterium sp. JP2137 TaxID=3414510 RepID=UPI003D2FC637